MATDAIPDWSKFVADHPYHTFVGGMVAPQRPGVHLLNTILEYYHYPPGTPANDDLLFVMAKFGDASFQTLWTIVGLPTGDAHLFERYLSICGLRSVPGVPVLLGSEKPMTFPAKKRIRFLENLPGSPVYASAASREALCRREMKIVNMIQHGARPKPEDISNLLLDKG